MSAPGKPTRTPRPASEGGALGGASSSPPRITSQEGAFGEFMRSAVRYAPGLDQPSSFRALVEGKRRERQTRSRSFAFAFAFAFACLAVAGSVALWPRSRVPGSARVEQLPPPAALVPPGPGDAAAVLDAVELAPGDTELGDGTRVGLAERSKARAEATPSGSRIALEYGRVSLDVVRQSAGRTLEVRAGSYRFVVLGTSFTVSSSPERVAASVREGRVAVLREQVELVELRAGETWSSDAVAPGAPPPAGTAPARASAPVRQPATPSPVVESGSPAADGPDQAADADCLGLARRGRARDAERCFEAQAAGDGLRSELAFFELARLRNDVLGDSAGALQALERYRARFPRGSLRAEVDLSYVHVLERLGRSRELLAETDRLLRSGSAREREGELRMLRGNTLRSGLRDFAAAEREYAAVERGGGKFAGEAAYYRGLCFEALGDTRAAAEAFRRYLGVPGRAREADARRRLQGLEP